MEYLDSYRVYFYGNEKRNAPCGYKYVKVYKGRKYVYLVKDSHKHECYNFKIKMPLTWWETNEPKFVKYENKSVYKYLGTTGGE